MSPPVVPRPRLLCPVGQLKRLLRQRLPEQIQGPDGLLLRPEGEFVSSSGDETRLETSGEDGTRPF